MPLNYHSLPYVRLCRNKVDQYDRRRHIEDRRSMFLHHLDAYHLIQNPNLRDNQLYDSLLLLAYYSFDRLPQQDLSCTFAFRERYSALILWGNARNGLTLFASSALEDLYLIPASNTSVLLPFKFVAFLLSNRRCLVRPERFKLPISRVRADRVNHFAKGAWWVRQNTAAYQSESDYVAYSRILHTALTLIRYSSISIPSPAQASVPVLFALEATVPQFNTSEA